MGLALSKFGANESNCDEEIRDHPVICVSGIPGAGNRTASEKISSMTGFQTIYPGDLARKGTIERSSNVRADNNNNINDNTNAGGFKRSKNKVSEKTTVKMIKEEMLKNKEAKGFVISGFPRNSKLLDAFAREVKMPEKVVALRVGNEIASIRLENKLAELGKSEREICDAENVVRTALGKIKKVHGSIDDDTLVTVNSSSTNINNWNRAIESATENIKQSLKANASRTNLASTNSESVEVPLNDSDHQIGLTNE